MIKYWLRAYTIESAFYRQMNIYLKERLGNQFDTYIKVLYYCLRQNYISSYINKELFRGGVITKDELKYINNSLDNKKKNLPGCICYNKSFLSTSKDKNVALNFMKNKSSDNNIVKVLYRIEPVNDLYKDNATNVDVEEYSYYNEKEILFFPFSCFEITSVEPIGNAVVEYDQKKAFEGADFIYAKNWSNPGVTNPADYGKITSKDMSWTVDTEHMSWTNNGKFMHCLPVRRNLIVTDDVIESPNSLVIPEAANREISCSVVIKRMLEAL